MSRDATPKSDDQHEVFAWLADPRAYAGLLSTSPDRIDIRETHGARVYLAGDIAVKVKRAVSLGYLDFSTLAKREAACRRELEVNRPNAPEIYLGLVIVVRDRAGSLSLQRVADAAAQTADDLGSGSHRAARSTHPALPQILEWGVLMRRFPADALMLDIAQRSQLAAGAGRALGDMIFALHQRCVAVRDDRSVTRLGDIIEDIATACRDGDGDGDAFAARAGQIFAAVAPILRARLAAGFVRRCHGDLHLANLIWLDGRPIAFDAIEFDEAIATIDILYDLAFTVMDLDRLGLRREANALLNRWLWRSRDQVHLDALVAMPLFLALRAGVRAMVTADRAGQLAGPDADASRAEAHRLLHLALSYLSPPPARLIGVGGLSGSGKSTLAAALAPFVGAAPGAIHLRSDLERKALLDLDETQRAGADGYTAEWTERTYARLISGARGALRAGHCVVVDAVFANTEERAELEAVATAAGVPFDGIWLEAPADVLKARVEARRGDASDATVDVVDRQLGYEVGPMSWTRLAAGDTAAATFAQARRLLGLSLE